MGNRAVTMMIGMAVTMCLTACNSSSETADNDAVEVMAGAREATETESVTMEEESSTEEMTESEKSGSNEELATGSEESETGSDSEVLSADGTGTDGKIMEGEYSQADAEDAEDTTTQVTTTTSGSTWEEKFDGLSQEELDALSTEELADWIYKEMMKEEQGGGNSDWIPGNPVEGLTPDNGELPKHELGWGGEVPDALKGHHIQ